MASLAMDNESGPDVSESGERSFHDGAATDA